MILYKKEWSDWMVLEHEGLHYQLNDRDDLFYTLVNIFSPDVFRDCQIKTLSSSEFTELVNE